MGFRYRRSISLARGVRLNVTGRGVTSVCIGRRGATLNFSGRGVRPTVGVPGIGLSYTGRSSGPLIIMVGLAIAGVTTLFVQAARGSKPAQVAVAVLSLAVIALGFLNQADRPPTPASASAPPADAARAKLALASSPRSGTFPATPVSLTTLAPITPPIISAPDRVDAPTKTSQTETPAQTVTVLAYANVRAAPRGAVVGQLAAGEHLTVIAADHGWFRVGRNGTELGWIHSSLIAVRAPDQAEASR